MEKRRAPGKIQNNHNSHFLLQEYLHWANTVQSAFCTFSSMDSPQRPMSSWGYSISHLQNQGSPEPVKLVQEPTGKNSKAWMKARCENHAAPVWTTLYLTPYYSQQLRTLHRTMWPAVPGCTLKHTNFLHHIIFGSRYQEQAYKAQWDENNHLPSVSIPLFPQYLHLTSYF